MKVRFTLLSFGSRITGASSQLILIGVNRRPAAASGAFIKDRRQL
jgi:hypothetical protein